MEFNHLKNQINNVKISIKDEEYENISSENDETDAQEKSQFSKIEKQILPVNHKRSATSMHPYQSVKSKTHRALPNESPF